MSRLADIAGPPAANAQNIDAGYNPLDEMTSDSLTNERAWRAQHMNLPEGQSDYSRPAPMGKRPSGAKGIQQSPGTTQPTQSQAPVKGQGAPRTPPPGNTAATVASKQGGVTDMPAQDFTATPEPRDPRQIFTNTSDRMSEAVAPMMSALTPKPSPMGNRMAGPSLGMNNKPSGGGGIIEAIMSMLQSAGNHASAQAPARRPEPAMPNEMINAMLQDKNQFGDTQGNTPIR
jgi:hypothetical protein